MGPAPKMVENSWKMFQISFSVDAQNHQETHEDVFTLYLYYHSILVTMV